MEPKKVCCSCGAENFDEEIICNHNSYCKDCVAEKLFLCERCNSYHLNNEMCEVRVSYNSKKNWCKNCAFEYAFICSDCEEYNSYETDYITCCDNDICIRCENNYYYCDSCQCYVYSDDWNFDREYCYSCTNSLIKSYHHGQEINLIGQVNKTCNGLWRGIGIELEIDRDEKNCDSENKLSKELTNSYGAHLYLERDSSLQNGFEIISQPHTIEEFYKVNWQDVLSKCKNHGFLSHNIKTCGLHIHFSRAAFGSNKQKQSTAIAKVIYFYTQFWNDMLKVSRRTEEQAYRWAQKYCIENRIEARKMEKTKSNCRYYAVNNTNKTTVEFRLARGTLNINSFLSWIDLSCTIVKNSKVITWEKTDNPANWLKGINQNTLNYLRQQNAFEEITAICA